MRKAREPNDKLLLLLLFLTRLRRGALEPDGSWKPNVASLSIRSINVRCFYPEQLKRLLCTERILKYTTFSHKAGTYSWLVEVVFTLLDNGISVCSDYNELSSVCVTLTPSM